MQREEVHFQAVLLRGQRKISFRRSFPDAGHTTPAASRAPLRERAQPCSCLRGQVLGDGGPFSAAGGARGYGTWGF